MLGDRWARSDGVFELVRIDGDTYVFSAGTTEEIALSRDLGLVSSITRGSTELEFRPPPRIDWPLRVGASGSVKGTIREPRYRSIPAPGTLRWSVDAYETIRVPAGTFEAYRISVVIVDDDPPAQGPRGSFYQPAVRWKWEYRVWYAPAARQLVKGESDGLLKLQFEMLTATAPTVPPLVVTLDEPRADEGQESDGVFVRARVTSGRRVTMLTLTLNGETVMVEDHRNAPVRDLDVRVPIRPRDGANALVATAVDGAGVSREAARTFEYQETRRGPAVAVVPHQARSRWAVVVGIGEYDNPKISKLHYSVADADAIVRILAAGGFDRDKVLLLTDKTDRKPTLRNIRWALGTFLARSARKDDTVVIYFAGHGAPEIDQRGVERDGFTKYLVPSDADPDDLFLTGLAMDDLYGILGRIEAERVVMFVDACYSGAAGGRTFSTARTRNTSLDDVFLDRLARSRGRAIITASRPNEVSVELAELGHGLFTYFLTAGLRGAADANRDGIVSLQELYEYVEHHVVATSRTVGANQHPVMKGELEGPLPLVRVKR